MREKGARARDGRPGRREACAVAEKLSQGVQHPLREGESARDTHLALPLQARQQRPSGRRLSSLTLPPRQPENGNAVSNVRSASSPSSTHIQRHVQRPSDAPVLPVLERIGEALRLLRGCNPGHLRGGSGGSDRPDGLGPCSRDLRAASTTSVIFPPLLSPA